MSLPPIEHLVFSTRSATPVAGGDYTREVVSTSAGVTREQRAEFALRADITHSTVSGELTGPVYTLSPAGRETWLFSRAVSIGRYRKGRHQILVHGLLMRREHLDAVAGNPFTLADLSGPGSGSGTAFLDRHPGGENELAALEPRYPTAGAVADLHHARWEELSTRFAHRGAALWEGLVGGERVAWVTDRPSRDPVEWLLLALDPDDRPEIGFHTWYSHARAVDYRLLVVSPPDLASVRRQFRGLRVLEAEGPEPPRSELGVLAQRLLEESPSNFAAAVRGYRMIFLARRNLAPLRAQEASVALRAALREELSAGEHRVAQQLAWRGRADLAQAVAELGAAWERGPEHFEAMRESVARFLPRIEADELAEARAALRGAHPQHLLAFLGLLLVEPRAAEGLDWAQERLTAWHDLVRHAALRRLLAAIGADEAAAAAGILTAFALPAAAAEEVSEDADPSRPGCIEYALWLQRQGFDDRPLVAELEAGARRLPAARAAALHRAVIDLHRTAGRDRDALRVTTRELLPGMPAGERQLHLLGLVAAAPTPDLLEATSGVPAGELVWALVAGRSPHAVDWIGALPGPVPPAIAAPAGRLLTAIAAAGSDAAATTFDRLLAKLEPGTDPVRFATRVLEAAAERWLEEYRPSGGGAALELAQVRAADALVRVRCDRPDAEGADPVLGRVCLRALLLAERLELRALAGAAPADFPPLRAAWTRLLRTALDGRNLGSLLGEAGWVHWLENELDREPRGDRQNDLRYDALMRLLWRRFRSADPSDRGLEEVRILRHSASRRGGADEAWHERRVDDEVPIELRPRALTLLGLAPIDLFATGLATRLATGRP